MFVGKRVGKTQLGSPRRRREGMRIDRSEIGWEGVDWIHLVQDRNQWRALVNTIMNVRVPLRNAASLLTS
jgi:hypothetical protein